MKNMKTKILLKVANEADSEGNIFSEELLKNVVDCDDKNYVFENGKLYYIGDLSKSYKVSMESRYKL